MPLNPAHLGVRLIAATTFATWERKIAEATQRALAARRARVEQAVRGMSRAPVVGSIPPDPFGVDSWDSDLGDELEPAAAEVFGVITSDTAHYFTKLDASGRLPPIDLTHRLDRLVGKMQGLGQDTSDRLGSTLTQGVNLGEGIDKLMDRVQSVFDVSDSRAETIARTEVIGAANGASHDLASAIGDTGMVLEKTWVATADERTRETHADADGQTVALGDMFEVGDAELAYPGDENSDAWEELVNCRCVAGDTPIAGLGAVAMARRVTQEQLLHLTTAGGRHLTATPDHPVLTLAGFVPADSLAPGDEIVCCRLTERAGRGEPDVGDVPPTIEECWKSANLSPHGRKRVPVLAMDLNGHAPDSEVDVVRVDADLALNLQAGLLQESGEFSFATPECEVSGAGGSASFGWRLEPDAIGCGSAPGFDASGPEPSPHDLTAVADASGEREFALASHVPSDHLIGVDIGARATAGRRAGDSDRVRAHESSLLEGADPGRIPDVRSLARLVGVHPSQVELDRVLDTFRDGVLGAGESHVYDLQTGVGWFVAGGIIVHNCTLIYAEPDGSTDEQDAEDAEDGGDE